MEWTWEKVIENYERMRRETSRVAFAEGMLRLVQQFQSDPDLADLDPAVMHSGLDTFALWLKGVSKNLPPHTGFAPYITFFWIEPDHYRVNIAYYENLVIPADKVLDAAKYELERIRKVLPALMLSDEELDTWKKASQSSDREGILYRFSRIPGEWILDYLYLELAGYERGIRKADSRLRDLSKKEMISAEDIIQIAEEIERFDSNFRTALDVVLEVEEKRRSKEFLQKLSEKY